MAEDPAHVFVVAGFCLQDQCCRRVPELMHGDEEARGFFYALGDLAAQRGQAFVTTTHAREQPRLVCAAQQYVEVIFDVVIDQLGDVRVEHSLKADAVFDIETREDEPVWGAQDHPGE